MSRCTGHCCERFSIPLDVLTDPEESVADGDFIRDMLIFLDDEPDEEFPGLYTFTCRHYDRAARECTVYDQRPHVCRNHGTSYPCKHEGCTLTPPHHGDAQRLSLPEPSRDPSAPD